MLDGKRGLEVHEWRDRNKRTKKRIRDFIEPLTQIE